jgi:DNA polymerase (family 10)
MPIRNADIATIFNEIADLLGIQGDNPFRIRAYRNAARAVQDLGRELRDMAGRKEDLTTLPGIGADLAAKIAEIVKTGQAETLEKLRKQFPPGITDLLRVPNLGPKRVKALFEDLKIESLEQLETAAREGKIGNLAGFGEKLEQQILESIQAKVDTGKRFLRAGIMPYAEALVKYLETVPGVEKVAIAGSYRRARETVGDIDILVVADGESRVMDRFVHYDETAEVLAHGDTKSSIALRSGVQVDIRAVEDKSFGAALQYFTGSRDHNIALRKRGQERGLKINEYGVFKGERWVAGKTEEDVYAEVGLPFIPPELREDSGEIDAAESKRLPELVKLADMRGDLHMHTTGSDGKNTIREMAEAARARGYEYIAVTEHSRRLAMVGGLDEKRLMKQMEEIDRLNGELKGIAVLKGIEVDILEDGSLDLPDSVLGKLDLVIGSIHSRFKYSSDRQTERVLRAMAHPHFSIFAHPTGRLLLEREPYPIDLPRIIRQAGQRGCCIELNAQPLRLDLTDIFCRMAKEFGALVSINTDAHSARDLDFMGYGVGQARRGWLEKKDVLNTRSLKSLYTVLAKTMDK